jgi:hypothetical protein
VESCGLYIASVEALQAVLSALSIAVTTRVMAPASATSTGSGTPTSLPIDLQPMLAGFADEEFSNNLFSDLAPLLTLLGEHAIRRFLSMSLGWVDGILLAVGPLGITTTIVTVRRLCLQSIVGEKSWQQRS